jgi:hypothetical protein
MATAKLVTDTKKTIAVTLSEEEIMAIATACAHTTGGRHSPRSFITFFLFMLQDAGIEWHKSDIYQLASGTVDFKTAS